MRALYALWVVRTSIFKCPKFSKILKNFGNFRIASAGLQTRMWGAVHLPNSLQDTWEGCFEAPVRALCALWVVRTSIFKCPKISKFFIKISENFRIASAGLQTRM